jgi:hypothetical protein
MRTEGSFNYTGPNWLVTGLGYQPSRIIFERAMATESVDTDGIASVTEGNWLLHCPTCGEPTPAPAKPDQVVSAECGHFTIMPA